jgi:hypothetical protein
LKGEGEGAPGRAALWHCVMYIHPTEVAVLKDTLTKASVPLPPRKGFNALYNHMDQKSWTTTDHACNTHPNSETIINGEKNCSILLCPRLYSHWPQLQIILI